MIKSSIGEFNGIEIEKSFGEKQWQEQSWKGKSFLGIACKTGNIETIKWIVSCLNESYGPVITYGIFFKGIGPENEVPPITMATKPALDFLLHEGKLLHNH